MAPLRYCTCGASGESSGVVSSTGSAIFISGLICAMSGMMLMMAVRAVAIIPYATLNAMKSDTLTRVSMAYHQMMARLPVWHRAMRAGMIFTHIEGL